jgi:hypothetical protein
MQAKKVPILLKFSPFCIADPDPVKHTVDFIRGLHIHWQMIILMYNLRRSVMLLDDTRVQGKSYILETSTKLSLQEFHIFLE